MKYYGTISDPKDMVTKEYVDSHSGGVTDVTQNGTSVVSGGVAAVTVPTQTSDLNNDSGYITDLAYTKTTFTPTAGSNYPNYGSCYYETYGRLIHVHLGISGLTANSNTTVYTLPSAVRPATSIFGKGTGGTASNLSHIEIQTGGAIRVYSAGQYCGADITFIK